MPRRRGRLTKEQLAGEADSQLRDNARDMLERWFVAVKKNIDLGDNKTIEMVGRMFQYDKGPGGVTIFNQHLQLNAPGNAVPTERVRSFDQIIGKLEEQENLARANRALLAPVENSEEDEEESDTDIQDAELLDAETEEIPVGAEV